MEQGRIQDFDLEFDFFFGGGGAQKIMPCVRTYYMSAKREVPLWMPWNALFVLSEPYFLRHSDAK